MSSSKSERILHDSTNERKCRKNDSAIDLQFDIGELKSPTSTFSESMMDEDDDDVFLEDSNVIMCTSKNSQSRKRLNGTSTYRTEPKKTKRKSQRNQIKSIGQTLTQLRDEQARIDAHLLSITAK